MPAVVLLAAATGDTAAQPRLPDRIVRRIDSVFAGFTLDRPGCAVGVYENGHVAFAKGYGLASLEYHVPITPRTPFSVASLSKQFTAAAVALLVEQGRLQPDDDIHKYLPELPEYGKRVTIDHLVHHTSGIRDFWTLLEASGRRLEDAYTIQDVLQVESRQRGLSSDPGAEFSYNNTGYVLLGLIVQRVTGKSLQSLTAEQILGPLGMASSLILDDHNIPVPGRAVGYSPAWGGGGWRIDVPTTDIVGQSGLVTTIEDLQKWDENFYTGRVGGDRFRSRLVERGVLNNGTVIEYGYGLGVGSYRGLAQIEHAGGTAGYRSYLGRYPSVHTSVATFCNASTADAPALAHRVADIVLADRFTPVVAARSQALSVPVPAPVVILTPAERSAMAGSYSSDELVVPYELVQANDRLVLQRPRAEPDTLRVIDHETLSGREMILRFGPTEAGRRMRFVLDHGPARGMVFVRTAR